MHEVLDGARRQGVVVVVEASGTLGLTNRWGGLGNEPNVWDMMNAIEVNLEPRIGDADL